MMAVWILENSLTFEEKVIQLGFIHSLIVPHISDVIFVRYWSKDSNRPLYSTTKSCIKAKVNLAVQFPFFFFLRKWKIFAFLIFKETMFSTILRQNNEVNSGQSD